MDDVSTTYPGRGLTEMSQLGRDMSDINIDAKDLNSDPYNQSDPLWQPRDQDIQRGNSKDNDWYTFTGITLSFKILSEKERCNY